MSFATNHMTRGSRTALASELPGASRRSGIIDYRSGFSVPMPSTNYRTVSKPTEVDIQLQGEGIGTVPRTLSVSYTPCNKTVDTKTIASKLANDMVNERMARVGAPAASVVAPSSEMEALQGHLQTVAINQRDIYEQMSMYNRQLDAMSENARANNTDVTSRLTSVESLRSQIQTQTKTLDALYARLGAGAAGDGSAGLASRVQQHDDQLLLMGAGLRDHKANIDQVRRSVSAHASEIGQLDAGLVNHTEHIRQMRAGLTDHTAHLSSLLETGQEHVDGLSVHADDLEMIKTGMQNHSEHIQMMTEGLMDHTHNIWQLGAGSGMEGILRQISDVKGRVDAWDRNVVKGQMPRDCTSHDLSALMQARAR